MITGLITFLDVCSFWWYSLILFVMVFLIILTIVLLFKLISRLLYKDINIPDGIDKEEFISDKDYRDML